MSPSTKTLDHAPPSLFHPLIVNGEQLSIFFGSRSSPSAKRVVYAHYQLKGHCWLPFMSTRYPRGRFLCINNGQSDAHGFPDTQQSFVSDEGPEEKNKASKHTLSSREMFEKLKRYGTSGILSYGILNTIYYLTTFLVVWFYVAPVPGKMGYVAAAERFLKVMAMVWAGSQVTKLIRLAGAIALAPLVNKGLSWFTVKFRFESQGKASMAIVLFCLGVAASLFLVVTLLWA